MAPVDPRMAKMAEVFKIVQDSVTKEELVMALEAMKKRVDAVGASTEKEFKLMHGAIDSLSAQVKADASDDMKEMQDMCETMMAQVAAKLQTVQDGEDGEDGKDAKPEDVAPLVVPLVLAALPKDEDDTGDQIITKINSASELIQKSAIEGMADLEKAVAEKTGNTTRIGWGAHPLTIYHNTTVIDKNTRFINFGSGLTVSRNAAGVVTVSASGGSGGVTELTATGTINSSNTAFTFVSKPTYVYVDGTKYRENEGWTWDSGSLTATVTKAPDYSIWGES